MNVISFVSFVAMMTFVTGFVVATIIWGINAVLTPGAPDVQGNFWHRIFGNRSIISEYNRLRYPDGITPKPDMNNRELYKYYHNGKTQHQDSVNKELYAYNHGEN